MSTKPLPSPRANFFDASALVKVFAREPDSGHIREYWNSRSPTKYTSPFCLYEAMTVLKTLWLYRKVISEDQYHKFSVELVAWFSATKRYGNDIDLHDIAVLKRAQLIAQRHHLDLSDSFQILSVKEGLFSRLVEESQTVLVTADAALAKAARIEGVKSWYCIGEPEPE